MAARSSFILLIDSSRYRRSSMKFVIHLPVTPSTSCPLLLRLSSLPLRLSTKIHEAQHIRDSPPPIQTINVKRLPEKDLPGWGSNVPNPEEWEALEQAVESDPQHSRILPLKDLGLGSISSDQQSIDNTSNQDESESVIPNQDGGDPGFSKPKKYMPKKREVKIEGKKMVASGVDASQGASDDNADDWRPAVSRSTHRRFLRRKARREMNATPSELSDQVGESNNVEKGNLDDDQCPELLVDQGYDETEIGKMEGGYSDEKNQDKDIAASLNKIQLEEVSATPFQHIDELQVPSGVNEPNGDELADSVHNVSYTEDIGITEEDLGNLEIPDQAVKCNDSLHTDDASSEQSWTLRSMSESSVACITSDFAMQNVLLQMGLRLLAPGGMQIRELHRWVLKCHACFKVTTETGRIFCPKCGNGGTLRKVAVTVNENGIVLAGRRPRVSLRGTKFSLPMPQGGRDAVSKNPILREDQLPQKYLYPKTKKKNKQDDEFFIPDDIFRYHGDKKAPLQPPIRKTVAVFSGKRNPNDNHYARTNKA
ncbi:RNA-binding NOB1-like protein isoform X2 [Andrographis paniculata]|uniref:RNA-binding NOB1-like protein isoform X2 n=1 Tax=Andrographis paniculata TaxID=175694 RepID=UPI0021E78C43|nr:RNA-binding NOB1-like protein isoform X2 [Andrographis paniculata]